MNRLPVWVRGTRACLIVSIAGVAISCAKTTSESGGGGAAAAQLSEVNISLPAKNQLPAAVAHLVTHYEFQILPFSVAELGLTEKSNTKDPKTDCNVSQNTLKGAYTQAAKLNVKLKKACSYRLVMAIGTPDASGKLISSAPVPHLALAERVPAARPAGSVVYQGESFVVEGGEQGCYGIRSGCYSHASAVNVSIDLFRRSSSPGLGEVPGIIPGNPSTGPGADEFDVNVQGVIQNDEAPSIGALSEDNTSECGPEGC